MIAEYSLPKAKPFVKWAGGKTQLLPVIEQLLPASFARRQSVIYVEPFVGGGAVMFHLLQKYPNISRAIICDINLHLIHTYQAIKFHPTELIALLSRIETAYNALRDMDLKKQFFLRVRQNFNEVELSLVEDAAYMIFGNHP